MLLFFIISNTIFAQSIDKPFSQKKMRIDFETFKKIRLKANSGLYKYRTKQEIDSTYNWADKQIDKCSTYREFYNVICQLTDFEGSLHNYTNLPKKLNQSLKNEQSGYFPYPIKWLAGKWIINYDKGEIPLGAQIISINNKEMEDIIKNLYKYYTTDGVNTTGKTIGINESFSRYYRLNYGLKDIFKVVYKVPNLKQIQVANLENVSYKTCVENFERRYSKLYDNLDYEDSEKMEEKYSYKKVNNQTGILTINTFLIGGNADDPKHKIYLHFLDSIFSKIKVDKIKNLIINVRHNGGGTDPNDIVTYAYLAQRNFSENIQAWSSFIKIPYLRFIKSSVPYFLRPLFVGKYNKEFRQAFPLKIDGKFYEDEHSKNHKIRKPNEAAYKDKIYLLISPRVASAGSLFAAMVTGNDNSVVIGEETMGGYYGHSGHIPLAYVLPKSKIITGFSIVNLEQDVPKKENQLYNRGIIPDYNVTQTYEDYLNQEDTQMKFVLDLINKKMME